jgi:2-dehydropantoate 2-reductase
MRIAVMGSGGIGGYVGGQLAAAGEDVAFIARGAHLEALRRDGLRIESPLGPVHLPSVTASDSPAALGPADIVLFAVKLYDTEQAAAALAPLIGERTRVVSLQNGIDAVPVISRHVGEGQVVAGAIYVSAHISRPGVISHAGGMQRIIVGRAGDPVIRSFAAAFATVEGLQFELVDDAEPILWDKFVTLCAFSGATAIMRSGIGAILADPLARGFLVQLRDEGIAVARALGKSIDDRLADHAWELWSKLPPDTRSSMAVDLDRGRRLELEWLSGRMHQLGQQLGIATPAHTAVFSTLHLHAKGRSGHPVA